jgi:uncharacterized membrane protein
MTDDDMAPDALENDGQGSEASGKTSSLNAHQDFSSDDTPESINEIIREASQANAPQEAQRLLEAQYALFAHFQGPLPPPSILEGYEGILPGSAHRIIIMAEKQQDHRMELERAVIHSDILMERLGLGVYAVLATILSGGGIWLLSEGREVTGLALLVINIAALAGTRIDAQRQRRRELQERKEALKEGSPSNRDETEQPKDK